MLLSLLTLFNRKRARKINLRTVLIIPFVLQIVGAVGLVGYLSFKNGQKAVNELVGQLQRELTNRVEERLTNYLDTPHLINQINAEDVNLGKLDLQDISGLERHFWKQLRLFEQMSYIYVGTPQDVFSGAEQVPNQLPHVAYWTGNSANKGFKTYQTDAQGNRQKLLSVIPNYELQQRPWYLTAKDAKTPVWGDIYVWAAPYPNLALPAVRPIYNAQDELTAVFAVDLSLSAIGEFLRSLEIGKTGQIFIMEHNGLLVASSTKDSPFTQENEQINRLQAVESQNPLVREAALFLQDKFSEFNQITHPQHLDFTLEGKRQIVQVTPYQDEFGLDWLIVVVIPEVDFMAQINRNTRNTIALCIAALILSIAVGILLARWVTQPILRLNTAAKAIAQGEWDQTVEGQRSDEVGELAKSFNTMAKQLQGSFETLAQQNEELQRLDQLKDEFLANTSHELRTPLNGIIGIAESLMDGVTGDLPETTRNNLAMIVSSGRRLSSLVNDILDFAKLRHQHLDLQLKPVDLRSITDIVLMLSQPLITHKDVKLINAIPADLPAAQADENRLQQILHNLVGNAIKFTPSGQITVSAAVVSPPPSSTQNPDNPGQIILTVSDTGIGIPEDKLERIFVSFEQGEGTTAREYGGTGLGLAVTKHLVELHGGTIHVTSKLGEGSQFSVTLPLSNQSAEPQPPRQAIAETIGSEIPASVPPTTPQDSLSDSPGIHVLIVDDEPINLQVLRNNLSLQNYVITQANNGQEALELITNGLRPDIILLDVMMPKMTGYELTEKLRQRFNSTELPILLLTAKNQVQDIVTGLNSGANDYLSKPISKDELLARIQTHLNIKHLQAENLRLATELDVVRKMQQMVLPKASELDGIEGLEIAGFMESAEEVGGDYYDVLTDMGRVKIGIGDVTGHGLESGVLMIMAQTAIRTLQNSHETDPVRFLDILNRTLYANLQRMDCYKNMTLILIDYADGFITLSGQHEEIIVVRTDGRLEKIDTLDLGFPIGLDADIIEFIAQARIQLNSGDVVVLYTDGITEAENIHQSHYGLQRLCEIVQAHRHQSASEIRQIVIEDVRQYIGQQKVFDDITLLVLKQQ
ncbi:MAG: SpoIIE family protein phosphatase [Coleofasciculus sp. B1-GNL1-01]|uniref:SpoIIE family protein phosphatase n=1 Tax=Coleofasciculus sp. B1-GNL1-01 TaxID=3068484 RepID=UPI0032F8C433